MQHPGLNCQGSHAWGGGQCQWEMMPPHIASRELHGKSLSPSVPSENLLENFRIGTMLSGTARADYQSALEQVNAESPMHVQNPYMPHADPLAIPGFSGNWAEVAGMPAMQEEVDPQEQQQRMAQMVQVLQALTKQQGLNGEWYQQTLAEISKRMPGFDATMAEMGLPDYEPDAGSGTGTAFPLPVSASSPVLGAPCTGATSAEPEPDDRIEELSRYIRQQAHEYVEGQAEWSRQMAEVRSETWQQLDPETCKSDAVVCLYQTCAAAHVVSFMLQLLLPPPWNPLILIVWFNGCLEHTLHPRDPS